MHLVGLFVFQPTIGSESLYHDSNVNVVTTVNFDTSKHLVVKSTMLQHGNIRKCSWTLAGGKTHNQIYHILIDRRWHCSVLDVRSVREMTVLLITVWWLQNLGKDWQ